MREIKRTSGSYTGISVCLAPKDEYLTVLLYCSTLEIQRLIPHDSSLRTAGNGRTNK